MFQIEKEAGEAKASMDPKHDRGIYLGVRQWDHKYWIGEENGEVTISNHMKWRPEERQWDKGDILNVKGAPWNLTGGECIDAPGRKEETREEEGMDIDGGAPEVRRSKITAEMKRRHGGAHECQGCRAHERGRRAGTHSSMCRAISERLEEERGNRMKAEYEERKAKREQREEEHKEQEEENNKSQEEARQRARRRAEET